MEYPWSEFVYTHVLFRADVGFYIVITCRCVCVNMVRLSPDMHCDIMWC